MRRTKISRTVAALCVVAGCSTCGGQGTSAPTPGVVQVAGTYTIDRTVITNTCDSSTTSPSTTATVAQAPGSTNFTLTDISAVYQGRVSAGGSFAMDPLTASGHDGATVVVTFQGGRFTIAGLTAQVTIDNGPASSPPAPACRIVQGWNGTKQGAPNVIP